MPAKPKRMPLNKVSQNVNQKVANEGEYDTPFIRMLTIDKNRHWKHAASLQRKLDNLTNASHELENKLRDENRELKSQNESLSVRLQNCGISNFWFIAGTLIFAVIGAMNTSLIERIGKLGYYCSFCVACSFVLFHIIPSVIKHFSKKEKKISVATKQYEYRTVIDSPRKREPDSFRCTLYRRPKSDKDDTSGEETVIANVTVHSLSDLISRDERRRKLA
jgi:hypothetical protein